MFLRRALPAARQSLAHPFPIYEMGSKEPHAQLPVHLTQATAHSSIFPSSLAGRRLQALQAIEIAELVRTGVFIRGI